MKTRDELTPLIAISERVYRGLLKLYPPSHRSEYGWLMHQLFQDQCRQAFRQAGSRGVVGVWLRVLPDIGNTLGEEYFYEARRSLMVQACERNNVDPRAAMGMLIAAVFVALGVLGKAIIFDSGGSIWLGTGLLVLCNLMGAVVMELFIRTRGTVIAATLLLIAATFVPLLWVPDATTWLRENPVNAAILFIATLWTTPRGIRWPIYAVALIMSAALIIISFI